MIQFKVSDRFEIELDPNVLIIPEFGGIVRKYGDRGKKMLTSVYLYADYRSPFSDMLEADRQLNCNRIMGLVMTEEEEQDYMLAIEWYEKCNETSFDRSLKAIDGMIDKLTYIIETHEPILQVDRDSRTGKQTVIDTTKHVKDLMKDLEVVFDRREKLKLRLDRKNIDTKARGNVTESMLSRGAIGKSGRTYGEEA